MITIIAQERWYATLPKSLISITTPKGVTLTIKKFPVEKVFRNDWVDNPKVKALILSIYGRILEAKCSQIQMTADEIKLFAMYSDKQNNLSKIL